MVPRGRVQKECSHLEETVAQYRQHPIRACQRADGKSTVIRRLKFDLDALHRRLVLLRDHLCLIY